jgi:hypothetical protein
MIGADSYPLHLFQLWWARCSVLIESARRPFLLRGKLTVSPRIKACLSQLSAVFSTHSLGEREFVVLRRGRCLASDANPRVLGDFASRLEEVVVPDKSGRKIFDRSTRKRGNRLPDRAAACAVLPLRRPSQGRTPPIDADHNTPSAPMASSPPSQPVNIGSPRNRTSFAAASSGVGTPRSSTPGFSAFRAQYAGTPPPVANIPPRGGTPRASPAFLPGTESPLPRSLSLVAGGGLSASRSGVGTPASGNGSEPMLDEMTEEEQARVLRRHLVSREEREQALGGNGGPSRSDAGSDSGRSRRSSQVVRQDSEAFPVAYHAPGADITFVFLSSSLYPLSVYPSSY